MANKKVVSVLSTAAIGTLIATAVGSTVFAAVDGLVVKNAAGAYLNYDLDALKASVVNDALGQAGAELYKDFDASRTAGSIVSYHDDKVGFVDAASVQKAALDAALAGTEFKLDTFTESSKETVLPAAVYQAEVKDGKVVKGAEVKPTSAPVVAELKVESVTALNLKQVKVTFNQEVDKTTAETVANYSVAGTQAALATLQDDKKSVLVDLGAGLAYNVEATLKIDKVKTAGGTALASAVESKFTPVDNVIPTVASVVAVGNSAVKVTFSEPVQTLANTDFTVDSVQPTAVAASADRKSFTLTGGFTTPLAIGEHSLVVTSASNVTDYAGYKVQPLTVKFNVQQDTTVPAVESATAKDQTTVVVKFNKPVNLATGNNYSANFYWNVNGVQGYTQYSADAANTVVKKIDDKTFEIGFTTTNYLRTGTAYLFVTNVQDFNGNTVPTMKLPLTVVADQTPAISKVEATNDKTIVLTFNKVMNQASAQTAVNYKLVGPDSKEVTLPAPVYNTTNKTVTFTFGSALVGGDYQLTTKDVKDAVDVKLAETVNTVKVTDTTAPTALSVSAVEGITEDTVFVTFPEAMATSGDRGIDKIANYKISIAGGAFNSVLTADSTAKLTVIDNKNVKITLAAATIGAGATVDVQAILVADASNNIIPAPINAAAPATIVAANNKASIAGLSTKIVAKNKIEFTIARKLTSLVPSDFMVNDGAADLVVANAEFVNSTTTDTAKVTITMPSDLDLTKNYTVKTVNLNPLASKDKLGLSLLENVTTAAAVNYIAPNMTSASLVNGTTVRVSFDKAITVMSPADFAVVVGDKTYTPSGAAPVAGTANKAYDLTITAVDLTATPLVKTVAVPQSEDSLGTKLVANTTGTTAKNARALTLSMAKGATAATVEGDETIVLTFDSALSATSIDAAWTNTAIDLAGKTVTLTNVGAANDTITIAGVGTITTAGNLVTTGGTFTNATYKLSTDKKTLTITLGTAVGGGYANIAAADADITTGAAGTATFVADNLLKNADAAYLNNGYSLVTGTAVK